MRNPKKSTALIKNFQLILFKSKKTSDSGLAFK